MASLLFELGHPKHYLQFREPIRLLRERHEVHVAARDKDVLFALLEADGERFMAFAPNRGGLRNKVLGAPRVLAEYGRILRRIRPHLIVSRSSPYAAVLGRLTGARTVVFPDSEGVALNERVVVPLSTYVVTSASFERDYGRRHYRLPGIFEAGYLHPRYFLPQRDVLAGTVEPGERYALFRFVRWSANHDVGRSGISSAEKVALVEAVGRHMKVFISDEGPLPPALEPHRLPVPPSRMHDALAMAALYVGDSQTMATEAALLGTPAVRTNSFVGARDFSNFRNLESRHGLLRNFSAFADALACAEALAADPGSKALWEERRDAYFATVGDLNRATAEMIDALIARGADSTPLAAGGAAH